MKKISKLGLVFSMVLVLMISLSGCQFGKKNVNRTPINKGNLEGYTEYVHSSGVKFSYPSEWKSLGSSSTQPVFGDTTTGTSVNYLSESVAKTVGLDIYMTAAISNVKKQMDVDGDVEEEAVTLNGKEATIIKYTVTQAGSKVIIKQACFLQDGAAHILTVACLESNYDDQAEIMDNIISSFTK